MYNVDEVLDKRNAVKNEELDALQSRSLVKQTLAKINKEGIEPARKVTIAVSFRTDQRGKAHVNYDKAGLEAMNNIDWDPHKKGGAFTKIKVETISLPRGAAGEETPDRVASFSDLDGVDLVFIPGSPAAIESQVATSAGNAGEKEKEFNRWVAPESPRSKLTARQRRGIEASSRGPYELQIIKIARDRGIPILAVCAGSWRLLESYGGKVRTLPVSQRKKHKAEKSENTWHLTHGVHISQKPGGIVKSSGPSDGAMPGINSTHWAVACVRYNEKTKELDLDAMDATRADPDALLDIAAYADDPVAATVEAFESKYGAPTVGIQWHPETYLPGMPGADAAPGEGQSQSQKMFDFMIRAAFAAKTRRVGVGQQLAQENAGFERLCVSAKLMAKGQVQAAESNFIMALNALPVAKWSGSMEVVFDCIVLLEEVIIAQKEGKNVTAANLYRDAATKLRALGVMI